MRVCVCVRACAWCVGRAAPLRSAAQPAPKPGAPLCTAQAQACALSSRAGAMQRARLLRAPCMHATQAARTRGCVPPAPPEAQISHSRGWCQAAAGTWPTSPLAPRRPGHLPRSARRTTGPRPRCCRPCQCRRRRWRMAVIWSLWRGARGLRGLPARAAAARTDARRSRGRRARGVGRARCCMCCVLPPAAAAPRRHTLVLTSSRQGAVPGSSRASSQAPAQHGVQGLEAGGEVHRAMRRWGLHKFVQVGPPSVPSGCAAFQLRAFQ